MTIASDRTKDNPITVVSGGLYRHPNNTERSATVDAQEKKCFFCRQDRQKVK
jgi:hypothetical protein